jgi:predicted transcriptional regulator
LIWGTYYASSSFGGANTTDGSGNVYLVGSTSLDPTVPSGGHQSTYGGGGDAFIVKFNSNGVRQWATYYGGNYQDNGTGCTTDNLGNVYLCGWTRSQNNIGYNGHLNSANTSSTTNYGFLVKFNSNGVRQWATYYGDGGDDTRAISCATDGINNVYLSGLTSADLDIATPGSHQPVYGGGPRDAFLVKFNSAGIRLWATYYGGSDTDMGTVCAVDNSSENVYLTGATGSYSNIAFNGHQNSHGGIEDAFIVKFDSSGTRQWATYYGGSSYEGTVGGYDDLNASIALDDVGNIFLAGRTRSTNNIAFNGYQNALNGDTDAFLVKFNSSGIRQWGTYYGGSDRETGYSCATDNNGNIFMVGNSNSTDDMLSTPGVHQETKDGISGWYNTFLVKFNPSGIRQWGTYYGVKDGAAVNNDNNGLVGTCSVDNSNNVYVGGFSESGNHAYQGHQSSPGGSYGTFLGKFFGTPCVTLSQPSTISGNNLLCEGETETYSVTNDPNATSYTWILPSGWSGTSTNNSITATTGTTGGTIEVIAENSCGVSSSQTLSATVNALPTVVASGTATICEGTSTTLTASGATNYTWDNGAGSGSSVSVSPTANTTYTVTGTDGNGCENTDNVTISVNSLPTVVASGTASICEGESTTLSASGATNYTWDNGAGSGSSVSVSPTANTTYTVTGTDGNGCENTDNVTVTVNSLPTVVASGTTSICEGESTTLTASGATNYMWDNGAGSGSSVSVSPTANTTYTVTGTDGNGCGNTDDVTVTVNALPTISSSADETICEGESVTISATGGIAYTWDNGLGSGSSQTVNPTSTTTYTVTGTDANGCENTDDVTISTTIVPDNGVTLESDQVTMTANSSGIDYTWIDCDNNFQAIPGETNQSFTATDNGNYAVIVSNQGCADTSDCIVIDKVSLASNTLNPSITLVPNPTSSLTKIVTDAKINKIQVVDFSGKIIEVPQNATKTELDFSNLSRGTYFINIETSYGSYVERVVVM